MKSILILILVFSQSVLALECPPRNDSDKNYGNRGDRCEGKYSKMASLGRLEISLISATTFIDEKTKYFSSNLIAEFCHTSNNYGKTSLKIESKKSNYRIDNFRNDFKPITPNCNRLTWSSKIIKNTELKIIDLGIVVKTGKNVIPARIYTYESTDIPQTSKYVFSFKTNKYMKWKYYISDANGIIIKNSKYHTVNAGKIFDVKWNGIKNKLGKYKLTIENKKNTFQKTMEFQHSYGRKK